MVDYSTETENGLKNSIIKAEDIYDFRGSPLEEFIFGYYTFCRENLDIESARVNITPNIFLFTNSLNINAKAMLKNKHFTILVNLGLLKFCVASYYENTELNNYFSAIYPDTISKFDNPINVLAYQVCTQFSYYHELAHLFQYSKKNDEQEIQERNDNEKNSTYDNTKHILEINADTYASIAIASHIEQYIKKTFQNEVNHENIFSTIVVLCCSLLNYILNFSDKAEDLYIYEHTHPHSFIRLFNSILNIVSHLGKTQYFVERDIKLNENDIFITVMEIYKDLERKNIFNTNIVELIDKNKSLDTAIVKHLFYLIQFDTNEYTNAMTIWNKI